MKTQFEQMMDGLTDVEAFLAGKQEGFRAHVPQEVDVKAIRNRLGMTQARFSDTFGFSLDAIKHWEGGRRTPEAPEKADLIPTRNCLPSCNATRCLTLSDCGGRLNWGLRCVPAFWVQAATFRWQQG